MAATKTSAASRSTATDISQDNKIKEDLVASQALHGKVASTFGGMWALLRKEKAAHSKMINSYFKFWDKKTAAEESPADKLERLSKYTALTNAYYHLATDLYEYGWSQSFHFARYFKGEGFYQALARHEHYLAYSMNIKRNDRVLDVGCGVGGPAREIARFTGAKIVGLNNNDYQIERATLYTQQQGLSNQVTYTKGDFMKIPFDDNEFDMVYAIEATVHAPDLSKVYGEIFRVLKPGGTFGVYEWVMTDKFDEKDPRHLEIRRGIELGDGIPQMVSRKDSLNALLSCGFELLEDEDLAETDPSPLPWYYPLEGYISNCQSLWDVFTVFRMTRTGRFMTQMFLTVFEKLGMVSPGTKKVGEALAVASDALVEGGKEHLFTPMYLMIAKKPTSSAK